MYAKRDGREEVTGLLDEAIVDGTLRSDCQLNTYALRACWSLMTLLCLKAIRPAVSIFRNRIKLRRNKKRRRKPGAIHKDTTLLFSLTCAISMIALSGLGVLKVVWGQKYLVARDLLPSVLYTVGRHFFYFGVLYAQNMFLLLAFGNVLARKHRGFLKKARRNAWLKCILVDFAGNVITLAALYKSDFEWAVLTYKIKWLYGIVGMLGNTRAVLNLSKSMKAMFSGGVGSDKRIEKLAAASKKFKGRAMKSALINLPAGLVFLLFKPAWGFWAYFTNSILLGSHDRDEAVQIVWLEKEGQEEEEARQTNHGR